MNDEKLEQVLQKVEPEKRSMLKKLVVGAAFAVPVIASFSVKELAAAGTGSFATTTTTTVTDFVTTFTFTETDLIFSTSTLVTTITTLATTTTTIVTTITTDT
jgi:hypothetical protein